MAALEQPQRVRAGAAAERCAACGDALDRRRRYGAVLLAPCRSCGSQTALPRPSAATVAAFHDSDEYFDKTYFEARRGRDEAAEARFRRLAGLLGDRPLAGRRVLDVGCDTGELAAAAARIAGVVPLGVDVAHRPLEAARARGIEVFHGELADAPFRDLALITAIDVLEHTADPAALLVAARERLAQDGVVYLETPNWRSPAYTVGRAVAHVPRANESSALERLFPPEHVQYFTAGGLDALARRAGLRPRAIFTRRMDAVAGGTALRVALEALQMPGRELLLCALLERP